MNKKVSDAVRPFFRQGRRLIMTMVWLLACYGVLQAQELQVSGQVTSGEDGESLPGAIPSR